MIDYSEIECNNAYNDDNISYVQIINDGHIDYEYFESEYFYSIEHRLFMAYMKYNQ